MLCEPNIMIEAVVSNNWCLLFCGTERNGTPDSAKYLFCGTHRNGPKTASQLSGYYIEIYPKLVALISLCSKLERNGKCARFSTVLQIPFAERIEMSPKQHPIQLSKLI